MRAMISIVTPINIPGAYPPRKSFPTETTNNFPPASWEAVPTAKA